MSRKHRFPPISTIGTFLTNSNLMTLYIYSALFKILLPPHNALFICLHYTKSTHAPQWFRAALLLGLRGQQIPAQLLGRISHDTPPSDSAFLINSTASMTACLSLSCG